MFEIVESADKGKIVVATRDMIPGTLLFSEMPIMMIPHQTPQPTEPTEQAYWLHQIAMKAYSLWMQMSKEKQDHFLTLAFHVKTQTASASREVAKLLSFSIDGSQECKRKLSDPERELYVHLHSILETNAFYDKDAMVVYDTASRFSHACDPNVVIYITDRECSCRALVPIKKGTELTVDYNLNNRYKGTAERRYCLLLTKHFTCHCARCDAPGDANRQFDCFNPKCMGTHYTCQPILPGPPNPNDPAETYTGVEYVEPHLLPCTVCQRSPPLEYQAAMFALEDRLTAQLPVYEQQRYALPESSIAERLALMRKLRALPCPKWHVHCIHLQQQCMILFNSVRHTLCESSEEYAWGVSRPLEMLRVQQHCVKYPNEDTVSWLDLAMCTYGYRQQWAQAAQLAREQVRMWLLLRGRETRKVEMDSDLLYALRQLAQQRGAKATAVDGLTVCAFCAESPEHAAMKRSICGACRAVMYCSKGCQKAHWPTHKPQCKKVVT